MLRQVIPILHNGQEQAKCPTRQPSEKSLYRGQNGIDPKGYKTMIRVSTYSHMKTNIQIAKSDKRTKT